MKPMSKPMFQYKDKSHQLQANISHYFNERTFSDITIVAADGRRLHCHQLILAASSPCLCRILEAGTLRAAPELPILGIDSDALEAVVRFFYTGECPFSLPGIVAVSGVAQRLEVRSLAEACEEFIMQAMHPTTCCLILAHAQDLGDAHLVRYCLDAVRAWFADVASSNDFLAAPFAMVSAVLSHCRAGVPPEMLFRAAWLWAVCDIGHTRYLQDLAQIVPLPQHLTMDQLLQIAPPSTHRAIYERMVEPGSSSRLHLEALLVKVWPELAFPNRRGPPFHENSARPLTLDPKAYDRGLPGGAADAARLEERSLALLLEAPRRGQMGPGGGATLQEAALRHLSEAGGPMSTAWSGASGGGGGNAGGPGRDGREDGSRGGFPPMDMNALARFAYGMMSGMSPGEALAVLEAKGLPVSRMALPSLPLKQGVSDDASVDNAGGLASDALSGGTRPQGSFGEHGLDGCLGTGRRITDKQHGAPLKVASSDGSMNSDRSGAFSMPQAKGQGVGREEGPQQGVSQNAGGQGADRIVRHGTCGLPAPRRQYMSLGVPRPLSEDDDSAYFEEQLQRVLEENDKWDIEFGREGIPLMGVMQHGRMARLASQLPCGPDGPSYVVAPHTATYKLLPAGALRVREVSPRVAWQLASPLTAADACTNGPTRAAGLYVATRPDHSTPPLHTPTKAPDVAAVECMLSCQVSGCKADLIHLSATYRDSRICQHHANASSIMKDGTPQRFCQCCGCFHRLNRFEGSARTCQRTASMLTAAAEGYPDSPHGTAVCGDDGQSKDSNIRRCGFASANGIDAAKVAGGAKPDPGELGPAAVKAATGSANTLASTSRVDSPHTNRQGSISTGAWGLQMLADIASQEGTALDGGCRKDESTATRGEASVRGMAQQQAVPPPKKRRTESVTP